MELCNAASSVWSFSNLFGFFATSPPGLGLSPVSVYHAGFLQASALFARDDQNVLMTSLEALAPFQQHCNGFAIFVRLDLDFQHRTLLPGTASSS
jgi:hypothetical protein